MRCVFLTLGLLTASALPAMAEVAATHPQATPPQAMCHQGTLPQFFEQYSAQIAVQEATTADPLRLRVIDLEGDPEPVELVMSLADIDWPLTPALTPFQAGGGEVIYEESFAEGPSVLLRGPDNGSLIRFIFRQEPCWQLVALFDDSM